MTSLLAPGGPPSDPILDAAVKIGDRLRETACWDRERRQCNWVGCTSVESAAAGFLPTPVTRALDPYLYAGSSGVALFLAELASVTGFDRFGDAAVAAARRSLLQARRFPPSISFYTGDLGLAYAADRVAGATGEEELRDLAAERLGRLLEAPPASPERDLLGGNAGAIAVLLAERRTFADERWRELAVRLGEEILSDAVWDGDRCLWPYRHLPPGFPGPVGLTGFSHGGAGYSLALLELSHETGRPEFLEAARGGIAHEDALFRGDVGNWPDLRPTVGPQGPSLPTHCAVAWCHGAPGIALSRLRAMRRDPENRDRYASKAAVALATTAATLRGLLAGPPTDATPCHGTSGLAETLMIGGIELGNPDHAALAAEAASRLIDRHSGPCDWVSGALEGRPNPSLMLGLAGVGSFFLRLGSPGRFPSILLPGAHDRPPILGGTGGPPDDAEDGQTGSPRLGSRPGAAASGVTGPPGTGP